MAASFARMIAALSLSAAKDPTASPQVELYPVHINPKAAKGARRATRNSMTNLPLDLHTDSTYLRRPHELVAFHMVRTDPEGGDTLLAPVEDVVNELDERVRSILRRPVFPFGTGAHPVLWERDGAPNIRYYRAQIDVSRKRRDRRTETDRAAMETLDDVLRRAVPALRFRLEAGDTLFLHNTKILHGRTGFAEGSARMMYRVRAHAACLG
jgi:alpha-ketoglutarate-dependent taurine dioxygenase